MPESTKRDQVIHNFTYHPINSAEQGFLYGGIREHFKNLALTVLDQTPPSREQSLALTHLEQALFWANAAIARNS